MHMLKRARARADSVRAQSEVAQGKPVARRGRKARDLSKTAQLPTSSNQSLLGVMNTEVPEVPYIIRPPRVHTCAERLVAGLLSARRGVHRSPAPLCAHGQGLEEHR